MSKWLGVRVPLSVGITFVKNDCNDLTSGASDHVLHHPSLVHTYFSLIMQCRASRVPRERSVRYPRHPGGSEVHYVCALLTDGVKRDQIHPMEGLYNHSLQT